MLYLDTHDMLFTRDVGPVSFEDIRDSSGAIRNHPGFHQKIKIVRDFRDALFTPKVDTFNDLMQMLHSEDVSSGRTSIIVTRPRETAFAYLYQERIAAIYKGREIVQPVGVFTDLPAAAAWVDIPVDIVKKALREAEVIHR